jgi:hypothetical protein
VLWFLLPALAGIKATWVASAFITTVLCDQTIRLARQIDLPNAWLAGPFVVLQHEVFPLTADTMTELPMALCLTVAIRLWLANHRFGSSAWIGYAVAVRPEGAFIACVWGCLWLARSRSTPWLELCIGTALLMSGVGVWCLTALAITGDPLYPLRAWSWPLHNYREFGHGSLFHHVVRWPEYCGPMLFIAFVIGLKSAWRRPMALPWAIWITVFGVHTVLWWGGWFSALGLMRIQACSAATTALICLHGWNVLATRLSPRTWRWIAPVLLSGAIISAPLATWLHADQHRGLMFVEAVAQARAHNWLAGPKVFAGDPALKAELGLRTPDPRWVPNDFDELRFSQTIAALPPGSVAIWDDGKGRAWYGLEIADIERLGYTIVLDIRHRAPPWPAGHSFGLPTMTLRVAVLIKR